MDHEIKPTLSQRFFAWGWPIQIWFSMFPLIGIVLTIHTCKPTFAAFRDWQYLLLFILAVIIVPIVSFLIGMIVSWPILGAIYCEREVINGGPFKIGDMIYIIAGKHKGKITRVYSLWQHGTVRVELTEKEKETFKDIFAPSCLLRVNDPGSLPNP